MFEMLSSNLTAIGTHTNGSSTQKGTMKLYSYWFVGIYNLSM